MTKTNIKTDYSHVPPPSRRRQIIHHYTPPTLTYIPTRYYAGSKRSFFLEIIITVGSFSRYPFKVARQTGPALQTTKD